MLNNTLYRLTTEKKLRLGFFGGSITDGTGATDMEKTSYRAVVTDSLRRAYPDAEITSVNAAIGGTGTGYGMFRCDKDLLSREPELIFIEFSSNDWGDSYEKVLPRAEVIFRKIRRTLPTADVVAVFTTYNDIAADIELGHEHEARSAVITAAHHYGFATADPGAALHARILRSGGVFADYIPDTIHPNDAGHLIMGNCIMGLLQGWLEEAGKDGRPTGLAATYGEKESCKLPAPICPDLLDDAGMISVADLENLVLNGFTLRETERNGKTVRYLEATQPGDSFSFTLRGRCLGFCWGSANINGDVTVKIDGGAPMTVKSWDHWVRSFQKFEAALVTTALDPSAPHKVTVTANAFTPSEVSPDEVVRIEYIFVC